MSDWNGVLPVDKPQGITSHDVVARARRALRTRRIGHTGTLDPFATGLLLLCLGPATRIAEFLTPLRKSYRATLRLGEATDTDDLTGTVLRADDGWRSIDEAAVRDALRAQTGTLRQVPPAYSAKKVQGVRAYDAARRGEATELAPVEVTVYRLEVVRIALPEVEFEVECSAGTYIRAIARDAGEALGVGGHLRALRRTGSGGVHVDDALPLDALDDAERVQRALIAPADAVAHLPRVEVDERGMADLSHGRAVPAPGEIADGATVALRSPRGELAAIGEVRDGVARPRKVFA